MEPAFNEERTLEAVSKMQLQQQLAAGAACCERMLPNYERFMREVGWGDIVPLRTALDTVWEACTRQGATDINVQELLARCEASAPDSNRFTSLYVSSAQDAVFSVCALLDFLLEGNVERIVGVFRLSIDSVDLVVQEEKDMDPRGPQREVKILKHPLMQQELGRQQRDLIQASRIGDANGLLAFRRQAATECNLEVIS